MDDYCADLVRRLDYDRFLMSLFVPQTERPALLAVCALNAELAQVRSLVSEEMIGHIRLAWWQEALEAGAAPRIVLAATHEATLSFVSLDDLKRHAIDLA